VNVKFPRCPEVREVTANQADACESSVDVAVKERVEQPEPYQISSRERRPPPATAAGQRTSLADDAIRDPVVGQSVYALRSTFRSLVVQVESSEIVTGKRRSCRGGGGHRQAQTHAMTGRLPRQCLSAGSSRTVPFCRGSCST
jgi:hypothetical protein